MKRKTLTLSLCLLAILSLVGIGFAAWQITKPAEAAPVNGSVVAYDATETGASISMSWVGNKNQFVFGVPAGFDPTATDTRTYKWFSLTDGANMSQDNHSISLTYEVTSANALLEGSSIIVYLKPTDIAAFNSVFNGTIAQKINGLALNYDSDGDAVLDSILLSTKTKSELATNPTQTIEIKTGWGTAFGGNPYTVFGEQEYSSANDNHVKCTANLDILYTNLEKLGFQLVLKNTEPNA